MGGCSNTVQERGEPNKWLVTAAVVCGTLCIGVTMSMMNLAIPLMISALQTDIDTIQWIITGPMLVNIALVPLVNWLTSLIGTPPGLLVGHAHVDRHFAPMRAFGHGRRSDFLSPAARYWGQSAHPDCHHRDVSGLPIPSAWTGARYATGSAVGRLGHGYDPWRPSLTMVWPSTARRPQRKAVVGIPDVVVFAYAVRYK
jgi:MFS family permease